MNQIATYCGIALGMLIAGGVGLLLSSTPSEAPRRVESANATGEHSPAPSSVWVANPKELINTQYGFSFKYPNDWGPGPRHDARVMESVGRRDGAFCYVFVHEQRVPADDTGKPTGLAGIMRSFSPRHLELKIPGLKTKVETFEKSTMGRQESRKFLVDFEHAAIGHIRVRGQATARDFGGIGVGCAAPVRIFDGRDLQAAFDLVLQSFQFDGRAR